MSDKTDPDEKSDGIDVKCMRLFRALIAVKNLNHDKS
jgi:hypothetical protein